MEGFCLTYLDYYEMETILAIILTIKIKPYVYVFAYLNMPF